MVIYVLMPNLSDAEKTLDVVEQLDGNSIRFDNGHWGSYPAEVIYIAIAEPPAARSLTQEEFAATRLNFETYDNRAAVREGEEAMAARQALINKLREQGYTDAEIDAEFGI